jgi:hypothetical protein
MGRIIRVAFVAAIAALAQSSYAGDIDRGAVDFTVPRDIKWVKNPGGTGEKFDPESTLPVPAGSYVVHYANKVHYDGAKGEETVIQVWGMGPATSTPAEKK